MVWPIMGSASYVGDGGKSMNGNELSSIGRRGESDRGARNSGEESAFHWMTVPAIVFAFIAGPVRLLIAHLALRRTTNDERLTTNERTCPPVTKLLTHRARVPGHPPLEWHRGRHRSHWDSGRLQPGVPLASCNQRRAAARRRQAEADGGVRMAADAGAGRCRRTEGTGELRRPVGLAGQPVQEHGGHAQGD